MLNKIYFTAYNEITQVGSIDVNLVYKYFTYIIYL